MPDDVIAKKNLYEFIDNSHVLFEGARCMYGHLVAVSYKLSYTPLSMWIY